MNLYFLKFLYILIILLPLTSMADTPTWQIVPSKSSLTFTATQNGAPVTGQFESFTGDIHFDPNQLSANNIKIVIDMNSITDSYNQLSDTLKTPAWFNTKLFPLAIFKSNEFKKIGDKTYQSKGMLTIRDKTLPVILTFTQEDYTQNEAMIKGSTIIKRTAFGVGQGEWADTTIIKDDVQINFTIKAIRKNVSNP